MKYSCAFDFALLRWPIDALDNMLRRVHTIPVKPVGQLNVTYKAIQKVLAFNLLCGEGGPVKLKHIPYTPVKLKYIREYIQYIAVKLKYIQKCARSVSNPINTDLSLYY